MQIARSQDGSYVLERMLVPLDEDIHSFLRNAEPKDYWRATELHHELVGPGTDCITDIKTILESGVDAGIYERLIKTIKKRPLVGYRLKRAAGDAPKTLLEKTEEGWERRH